MNFLDLIKSTGYITVSKELAHEIGLNETVILSELISQYEYFKKNNKLRDQKWFFCTIEKLEEQTTLNRHYQDKAIATLKKLGLIEVDRKGLPARRHFKIIEREILNLFFNENADNPRNDQIEKVSQTRVRESTKQDCKSVTNINNNNNNNKTEEEDARAREKKSQNKEIPPEIKTRFEQIFSNRKLSIEFYKKMTSYYPDKKILLRVLELAEEMAKSPAYILRVLKDWKKQELKDLEEINNYLEELFKEKKEKGRTKEIKKEPHKLEELYKKGYR